MTDGGEQFGLGVHPRILSKHRRPFGHQDRRHRSPAHAALQWYPSKLRRPCGTEVTTVPSPGGGRPATAGTVRPPAHIDRGLDGNDAFLLREVLRCKALFHDSARAFPYSLRPGALHTELLQLCAPGKSCRRRSTAIGLPPRTISDPGRCATTSQPGLCRTAPPPRA